MSQHEPVLNRVLSALCLVVAACTSIVGLAVTALLSWSKLSGFALPCSANFQCEEVLASRWSHIGKLPISVLGCAAFTFILLLLAAAGLRRSEPLEKVALWLASISLVMSVGLTGLAHYVIHAHCVWCLTSGLCFAVVTLLLAIRQFQPGSVYPDGLVTVVAGAILVATGWVLNAGKTIEHESRQSGLDQALVQRASVDQVMGDRGLVWGDPHPKFSVVMFVDFQCEACHKFFTIFRSATIRHGGELVVRHCPMGWHTRAFDAAVAVTARKDRLQSEAARLLTQDVDSLELDRYIRSVKQTVSSQQWKEASVSVNRDFGVAAALGARSTPALLLVENNSVQAMDPITLLTEIARR